VGGGRRDRTRGSVNYDRVLKNEKLYWTKKKTGLGLTTGCSGGGRKERRTKGWDRGFREAVLTNENTAAMVYRLRTARWILNSNQRQPS